MVRTGALPTIPPGGGELAREREVEVIDMLSEICSLVGVPGTLTEAILGCLDGMRGIGGMGGMAVVVEAGGVSVFGVETTRNVLGVAFFMASPGVGLAGREFIDGVSGRTALIGVSVLIGVEVARAVAGSIF